MRKYTQLDGYTATTGYEIDQDNRGNLLIGTDNGGMIFDGKKFRLIGDKRGLLDAEVLRIIPLNDHMILLPSNNNICYWYKGMIYTAKEDSRLKGVNINYDHCMYDAVTGVWWMSDNEMKTWYCLRDGIVRKYNCNINLYFEYIYNNTVIGTHMIAEPDDKHICTYDLITRSHQPLYEEGKKYPVRGEYVVGGNAHWLVGYSFSGKHIKIYKYPGRDSILHLIKKIELPDPVFHFRQHIFFSKKNEIARKLMDLYGGVVYHGKTTADSAPQMAYHIREPSVINSIFIDRSSNLWLSAPNNTLYFISEQHIKNALLTARFPMAKKIPRAISGDGHGRVCISYVNYPDLTCIDGNRHHAVSLPGDFSQGSRYLVHTGGDEIIAFHTGIVRFNTRTQQVYSYPLKWHAYKDVCVMGSPDSLLTATNIGAFCMARSADGTYKEEMICKDRTNTIDILTGRQILIGTTRGLYIKHTRNTPAVKISHPVLSKSNIADILPLYDGGAFISTNTQGLFLLHGTRKDITPIKMPDNNDPGIIRRLYRQDDHTYWIATDNGAWSMTFDHKWSVIAAKNYTFYDGLPSNNVTDIYVCSDTAYFTTTQGLGIIPLKDSTRWQMAPPDIFINSVLVNKTMIYGPDKTLSLRHNQNNILLSLSAISFESFGNIRYCYQLAPLQHNWIETTNPEINFTELPPGRYTFRAYAINAKNVQSRYETVLTIYIRPAFWQTAAVKILLLLLSVGLLFLALRRMIVRRERKKYELLQQKKYLAELELEAIKAQINPHFIFNCLNSIQYLNYKMEYEQAQQYLHTFARLIGLTMQYSQETFITIEEETEYVSNYLQLEKLRLKDKLEYTIHIADDIDTQFLLPAMIIQPYVENALKHGILKREKGGRVSILFLKKNNHLHILIRDNGPGLSDVNRTGALGHRISRTRAISYNELFGLDIQVHCYNEESDNKEITGAVAEIIINTVNYGNAIQKSRHH